MSHEDKQAALASENAVLLLTELERNSLIKSCESVITASWASDASKAIAYIALASLEAKPRYQIQKKLSYGRESLWIDVASREEAENNIIHGFRWRVVYDAPKMPESWERLALELFSERGYENVSLPNLPHLLETVFEQLADSVSERDTLQARLDAQIQQEPTQAVEIPDFRIYCGSNVKYRVAKDMIAYAIREAGYEVKRND